MKKAGVQDILNRDTFEKKALRITGTSFYILSAGLIAGSILSIVFHKKPETTLAGIIISTISILTMFVLMKMKLKTGSASASSYESIFSG